jgi:DNA repair exonuclease SbcCD ATPase subunit
MGTLEEQIQKRDKELARRVDALKAQMKQAERLANKQQKEGPAQKMNRALDQGDFKKAEKEAEMLAKQLQDEEKADLLRKKLKDPNVPKEEKDQAQKELDRLEGQKLTQEQKEQLMEQLKDLQEKIERLSRDARKRDQELRDLAARGKISQEQLERELDELKENLDKIDPKTLEELKDLAAKLGECRKCLGEGKEGEAAAKLGECAGRLAKLDPNGERKDLARQLAMLQEARRGICQALDGNNPASGQRPEGKEHETRAQDVRSRSDFDKGKLQIVDQVPGQGLKTLRNQAVLSEEIRHAAQAAPEAIDRQRLPRSASDMARGYFEKLRGPDKPDKKEEK